MFASLGCAKKLITVISIDGNGITKQAKEVI